MIIPRALDDLMRAEGVDHALVTCAYSPKVTGLQSARSPAAAGATEPIPR